MDTPIQTPLAFAKNAIVHCKTLRYLPPPPGSSNRPLSGTVSEANVFANENNQNIATPPIGAPSRNLCPKCGFPLSANSTSCPNCGGPATPVQNPQPTPQPRSGGVSGTVMGGPIAGPKSNSYCTLRPIAWEGEERKYEPITYSGNPITLNRANTDANNNSITSREQAVLICENGEWFIENHSDLKTTFIRVNGRVKISSGDIIVLGNREFEFKA